LSDLPNAQLYGSDFTSTLPTKEVGKAFGKSGHTYKLHPIDVALGLNKGYLKSIIEYNSPTTFNNPFIGEEVISPSRSRGWDEYKQLVGEESGNFIPTIPIFSLGTTDPNILEVKIDVDKQYYALLNSADYISMSTEMGIAAIVTNENKQDEFIKWVDDLRRLFEEEQYISDDRKKEKIRGPKGEPTTLDEYPPAFVEIAMSLLNTTPEAVINTEWFVILEQLANVSLDQIRDQLKSAEEEEWLAYMWNCFMSLLNTSPKANITIGSDAESGIARLAMRNRLNAADFLSYEALKGSIKTIPMFHLAKPSSIITKKALLLCIEPEIYMHENATPVTWFSGIYEIFGFKNVITQDRVESEFYVVRPSNAASNLI